MEGLVIEDFIKSRAMKLSDKNKSKILSLGMTTFKSSEELTDGENSYYYKRNLWNNIEVFNKLCKTLRLDSNEYGNVNMAEFLEEIQKIIKNNSI